MRESASDRLERIRGNTVTNIVIATAITLSVLCYWGMPPVFVAYGV